MRVTPFLSPSLLSFFVIRIIFQRCKFEHIALWLKSHQWLPLCLPSLKDSTQADPARLLSWHSHPYPGILQSSLNRPLSVPPAPGPLHMPFLCLKSFILLGHLFSSHQLLSIIKIPLQAHENRAVLFCSVHCYIPSTQQAQGRHSVNTSSMRIQLLCHGYYEMPKP